MTGAGKRLGRAIALDLAASGRDVVVHYRSSGEQAEETAREIRAMGQQAWIIQADLGEVDGADVVKMACEAAGAPLAVLVNSASIFPEGRLDDMQWQDLEENVRINAWAPFSLARAFATQAPEGACIVNLLDTRIRDYDWQHVPYILSKQMLASMTAMLALHLAPKIRVGGVAPGPVLPPPGGNEDYLERIGKQLPLQRHGKAQDVARAVRHLVESPFVTGQILYVDGGRHLGRYRND